MIGKLTTAMVLGTVAVTLAIAQPAAACGFLVADNGAVRLVRTSTLVAWDGETERYITNFEFASPEASFGSIIPLPAQPTHVGRAGDWTLQRLAREVRPPVFTAAAGAGAASGSAAGVEVILETRVDSLDITVVRGGGTDVALWADEQGFDLGEGAADLLDFYSDRSPYFLAASFDASAAEGDGLVSGDGIPILVEIPVARPWVPLHILGFERAPGDRVDADVFLLTPDRPDLLHGVGLTVGRSEPASRLLLDDLRSDENMDWIPHAAWFTHLRLDVAPEDLTYDLSVGADGTAPSLMDAGFTRAEPTAETLEAFGLRAADAGTEPWALALLALTLGTVGGALATGAIHVLRGPGARRPVTGEAAVPRGAAGVRPLGTTRVGPRSP